MEEINTHPNWVIKIKNNDIPSLFSIRINLQFISQAEKPEKTSRLRYPATGIQHKETVGLFTLKIVNPGLF